MATRRNLLVRKMVGSLGRLLVKGIARIPIGWAPHVARVVAPLMYYLIPRVRRVGLANLNLVYGNTLTAREKRRILKKVCENVATVAAEFCHIPDLCGPPLDQRVTVLGGEHIDPDRGAIVIGAHLGNWEWMAPVMAIRGHKAAAIVRPLDDPRLNEFVDRMRRSGRIETIPKQHAAHAILDRLKEGYLVGILVDQNPRRNAVPIRFLGQPCWGTIGPVVLASRAGAPIHAASMIRTADGAYVLEFTPEIPMVWTGDFLKDLVENTQRCQNVIEDLIRHTPEQWLWLHRRWRPRPNLEQQWNARQKRGNAPAPE